MSSDSSTGRHSGVLCLQIIASAAGTPFDIKKLGKKGLSSKTLREVIGTAQNLGLPVKPRKANLEHLYSSVLPCVLLWERYEFVVLEQLDNEALYIVDKNKGRVRVPLAKAAELYGGVVLEFPGLFRVDKVDTKAETNPDLVAQPQGTSKPAHEFPVAEDRADTSFDATLKLLDFNGRRSMPVIMQSEAAECGLAALAMIASHYGQRRDLSSMRQQSPISLKGISLRGLIEIADSLDFSARPLRLELEALHTLKLPCILHWDMQHFVVLEHVSKDKITIIDPAKGRITLGIEEASPHFTGVALELTPSERFARFRDVRKVRITDLWQRISGLSGSLGQLFVLALVIQIFH